MILYLVQHGLAAWHDWRGADDERPLTPLGRQLMEAGAARLARLGLQPGLIFTSSLVRATKTAAILAAALGRPDLVQTVPALRHGFERPALVTLLRQHASQAELMFVGHQPGMSRLAEA